MTNNISFEKKNIIKNTWESEIFYNIENNESEHIKNLNEIFKIHKEIKLITDEEDMKYISSNIYYKISPYKDDDYYYHDAIKRNKIIF